MFFFRISIVVLMIFTFFHNGETVNGRSSQTNNSIIVQYNKLLNFDTGYSKNAYNKPAEITESAVTELKEKVNSKLLCTFVFTCRYYMNLIKTMVTRANERYLKVAFQYDMINASYFQNQIVTMFYVVKHLSTLNSLDPLWMMYAYMDCLKNVAPLVTKQNIKDGIIFKSDHDLIYRWLTQFTDNYCRPDNKYNHQYFESDYYKELNKLSFPDKNAETFLGILFADIIETIDKIHTNIRQILGIDNVHDSFIIDNLYLSHILLDVNIMKIMLDDFAEAKYTPDAYKTIYSKCFGNPLTFFSVETLVAEVGGSQNIFVNLMKYIIARQAFKYILDVHSSLLLYGKSVQPSEELTQWIMQSNLETTNKMMLSYYKDIISFLKIGEDDELKFVAEMFNSAPHVTFGDPMKNIDNETRIKNMLVKFSKGLHHFPPIEVSRADFYLSSKSQKKADVIDLAKRLNVEVGDPNGYEYEGMLHLFVFKVFITRQYGDTKFDIALSFYEFQSNYFNVYLDKNNCSTSQ